MNIQERLAKVRFFNVKPDFSSLDADQRKAISQCIDASNIMTGIYLDQIFSRNREIYEQLQRRSDSEGRDILSYFLIHGSPWDGYNNDEPFIQGVGEKLKFGSFYPPDLTKEEWNGWLKNHPQDIGQFESNYTVIRRKDSRLVAVPYSEEYRDRLTEASGHLERASSYLPEGKLGTFLQLRANAFRTNDYFESDMAWVDTDGNPFEVTIGPYEVYFDELLGLKSAFESFIALPDRDSTRELSRFSPLVPEFDRILSQEFSFKPKDSAIPLEVVADVIRGGDAGFGSMFSAYCLPNDRRVHDLKGSKKVFSRTMMEAKFATMATPIIQRILPAEVANICTFDKRLLFVLAHELAHGLGPNKVKVDGREIPFEAALGDLHSALEEAKADTLGTRLLGHFRDKGMIDDKTLEAILYTHVATFFQSWNHGFKQAHAQSELIEYNWLREMGALRYNGNGKFTADSEKCLDELSKLSTKILDLEISGDYQNARKFSDTWRSIPKEVIPVLEKMSDIPKAVSPVWDLSELKNIK